MGELLFGGNCRIEDETRALDGAFIAAIDIFSDSRRDALFFVFGSTRTAKSMPRSDFFAALLDRKSVV